MSKIVHYDEAPKSIKKLGASSISSCGLSKVSNPYSLFTKEKKKVTCIICKKVILLK